MNRCQPLPLGIAIGVLWAIYVLFVGIVAMFGWGVALVEALSSLYIGYAASIIGAIIGAIWAFVDGFIAGVVIAWISNPVAKQPARRECASCGCQSAPVVVGAGFVRHHGGLFTERLGGALRLGKRRRDGTGSLRSGGGRR